MEEYNTGTLPHDKYYDLGKWEATQNAIRMGETVEKDDGSYDARKDMDGESLLPSLLIYADHTIHSRESISQACSGRDGHLLGPHASRQPAQAAERASRDGGDATTRNAASRIYGSAHGDS
jgi:hypothetical protein